MTPCQPEIGAEEERGIKQVPDQGVADKRKRGHVASRQTREVVRIHVSEQPGLEVRDEKELHGAQQSSRADPARALASTQMPSNPYADQEAPVNEGCSP